MKSSSERSYIWKKIRLEETWQVTNFTHGAMESLEEVLSLFKNITKVFHRIYFLNDDDTY